MPLVSTRCSRSCLLNCVGLKLREQAASYNAVAPMLNSQLGSRFLYLALMFYIDFQLFSIISLILLVEFHSYSRPDSSKRDRNFHMFWCLYSRKRL